MKILSEDEMRGAIMLIFANKQDLPKAMSAAEVADKLGLASMTRHTSFVQPCCATSGEGLYEGLDWMSIQLSKRK